MAEERRRQGQVRRRHRRDRDRQGDHGGRGGRRGHRSARSWCRRHRRREVNTPIARALRRRRETPARRRRERAPPAAEAAPSRRQQLRRRAPKRRRSRRDRPRASRRAGRADGAVASPRSPPAPRWSRMTVREALRDAMAEEMRRDDDVFVMGEEVAEYQGAYKVTQGLLQEFGARRVIDTPITEHGFAGLGVGAALAGPEADRRVHDLQLRHAGDRPDHQLGGQDALHVRRPDGLPDRVPRPQRRRRARRRPAQPGLRGLVRATARA